MDSSVRTVFDLAYNAVGDPSNTTVVKHGRVTLECVTREEAMKILSLQGGCIDEWEPPYEAIPFGAIIQVKLAV